MQSVDRVVMSGIFRANPMKSQAQRIAALVLIVLGLALLVMMIIVEDEFGALPLALLAAGGIWYGRCWMRDRSAD